ncbi:MAG: hypothetical protein K5985_11710 [Lachnospiraceae bacterium]|nr:hypothetical protein [Lachnospiraceae bacterium]
MLHLKDLFRRGHKPLPGMEGNFYCTPDCDGCGECFRRCPTGHIKMVEGRPVWPRICLMCAACADVCPIGAIRYGVKSREEKKQQEEKNEP